MSRYNKVGLLVILACWTCPADARAQTPKPQTSPKLKAALKELFAAGLGPRRSAERANAAYLRALRVDPKGERTRYVWGLIQLRRLNREAGYAVLREVAVPTSAVYMPAMQAIIWNKVARRKSLDEGLALARDFASQLARAEPDARVIQAITRLAEVFAALRATANETDKARVVAVETAIRESLSSPELRSAWEHGRKTVQARLSEFQDSERARLGQRRDKLKQRARGAADRVRQRLDELSQQQARSESGRQQLRESAEARLSEINHELNRLEPIYQATLRQLRDVGEDYEDVARDFAERLDDARRCGTLNDFYRRSSTWRLQREIASERTRLMLAGAERDDVLRAARDLLAARSNVIRSYQRQTGQILQNVRKNDKLAVTLQAKQARLTDEIANAEPPSGRKPTFRLLVPFRLEAARTRVLHSFGEG